MWHANGKPTSLERTGLDRVRTLLTDESLWIKPPPDLADSIMRRIENQVGQ